MKNILRSSALILALFLSLGSVQVATAQQSNRQPVQGRISWVTDPNYYGQNPPIEDTELITGSCRYKDNSLDVLVLKFKKSDGTVAEYSLAFMNPPQLLIDGHRYPSQIKIGTVKQTKFVRNADDPKERLIFAYRLD